MANQTIFKSLAVSELRDKVRSGESLREYFSKSAQYPSSLSFETPIKVDSELLKLRYKGASESAIDDISNAIALYEAFPGLTDTQASDARLWTYLTHVSLRDYVLARWPLSGSFEQVMADAKAKNTAIEHMLTRWFAMGGNDRSLRRNAAARLWWGVRLTRAPWERDPEFFSDLAKEKDPYRFTRVLLASESIYSDALERSLGRDNRLLIAILEFIEQRKGITRDQVRDLMKELNLAMSVRNFSILDREGLKKAIAELGTSVLGPEVVVQAKNKSKRKAKRSSRKKRR